MNADQLQIALKKQDSLPAWKRVLFSVVLTFLIVLIFLGLGEGFASIWQHTSGSYSSARFRQYDPELGLSLIPNVHATHMRGCFKGEVSVNSWGMRDRPRSLEVPPGEFRIALLGDSTVEGVHVRPDQVVNIQMERLLAEKGYKNAEVLNFGIEGIGTTQEYLIYKTKVRRFHPDLVVLVLVDNDVMNNSSTIQPKSYGIHTWYAPYYDLEPDGNLVFRSVEPRPFSALTTFLENHSALTYYLERMWLRVNFTSYKWEGIPIYYGYYGDPPDPEWMQAWTVTEKVMAMLNEEVLNDGAKLLVVKWPGFYRIDPDWRQRMIREVGKVPPSFQPFKTEERFLEIAARNNIQFGLLDPYMVSYRDQHHLQWPFFSFSCDPHYSALGHQVVAGAILQQLEEHHMLPPVVEPEK